ncbi:MAG: hypothetical protein A3B30_03340 [Candidatus Komeilibacteria bacterium RIFCSPLOWO2_01_FULL_52_15]|uniref:Cell shape determination protein CcmA n=2 Tax=Candidatus Komeiliibacteriota TaxID=1817908 RepID=A0A1G2BQG0_9BACT|nr:MAG: hypothetical protein A2677_00530 [Candidatus Komeilibacteria bacterium RIFCSPHIGHO2_01_FULL_52_14]OGY91066.1 MAG: hypothetical protein A3B30_03340 [Candidatus Komeilibacteria bacterium RIFCSPLOWO2_01_FULL_52_15]
MFQNPPQTQKDKGSAETFIGPSVKLEGNFSGEGDVVIEGVMTGNLATKGDIRVGQGASIEAEVRSKNALIAGKVKGNITIGGHLKLASSAIINGDIRTFSLAIDEGAVVNGKIIMGKEKPIKDALSSDMPVDKSKA